MGRGDQPLKAEPMRIQDDGNNIMKRNMPDCANRFKTSSSAVLRTKQWPRPIVQTNSTERSRCPQNCGGKKNWKTAEEVLQGYFQTVYDTNSCDSLDALLKTPVFKDTLPDINNTVDDVSNENKFISTKQSDGRDNLPQKLCEAGDRETATNCEGQQSCCQQNCCQEMKRPSTFSKNVEPSYEAKNLCCDVGSAKESTSLCGRNTEEPLPTKQATNTNRLNNVLPQTPCDKFTSKNQANGAPGKSNGCIKPIIVNQGAGSQTLKVANLDTLVIQPGSPTVIEVHSATSQQKEQQQMNEMSLEVAGITPGSFCGFGTADGDTATNEPREVMVENRSSSSCYKQPHGHKTTDNSNNKRISRPCKNESIPEDALISNAGVVQPDTNNDECCPREPPPCHTNQQITESNDPKKRGNERQNQKCYPLPKKQTSLSWQNPPANCGIPTNVLNQDQLCGQTTNDSGANNENNEVGYKDIRNQMLKVTNLDTVVIQPGSPTLIQVCKSRGPQEFEPKREEIEHEMEYNGTCETDYESGNYGDKQSLKSPEYSAAAPQYQRRSLKSDNARYRDYNKRQNKERHYQKNITEHPQQCQDMPQQRRSVSPHRSRSPQCKPAPGRRQRMPARPIQNYQAPPDYQCAPETPQQYRTERNYNQQVPSNCRRSNHASSPRHSSKRKCAETSQYQATQNNLQCVPQTQTSPNPYQDMQYQNATNWCPPATNHYQDMDDCYGDNMYVEQVFDNTARDDSPCTEDQYEQDAPVPYSDYCDGKTNNATTDFNSNRSRSSSKGQPHYRDRNANDYC